VHWPRAFLLACAIWLGGMAAGYGLVAWSRGLPTEMPAWEEDAGEEGAGVEGAWEVPQPASADRDRGLFLFIFGRNVTVYCWLLAGLLTGGASAFLVLLTNGVMLGQTIGFAEDAGAAPADIAGLLLPHGMLEVGALCIAGAVGLQGLHLLLRGADGRWQTVKALRLGSVAAFGIVALAAAAGIETFVTGAIADAIEAQR
jgi:uncharacterized membrane protein SpoIIM required for sporulation